MEAAVIDSPAVTVPEVPGTPFAGGQYVGRIFVLNKPFALIAPLKGEGELAATKWGSTKKNVTGALSYNDGLANTVAMAEAGSSLGQWARELRIGGKDDWYLMSRLDALVCFGELPDQFERDWYWTSTQASWDAQSAWCQYFGTGSQTYDHKGASLRARAVRREPLS